MKTAFTERVSDLINYIPICIAYVDKDLNILFANNTYKKWFQLNPEELVGKSLSDYFQKESYSKIKPYLQQVLESGNKVQFNLQSPTYGKNIISFLPDITEANEMHGFFMLTDQFKPANIPQDFIQVLSEEKEKIKSEMDGQNRELGTQAILIATQQKALIEIKHSLKLLDGEIVETKPKKILKKMMSDIQSVEHTNNQWKRIKLHFEKIHPLFLEKLSNLHPQLNQNDLKHCAFIKLKLSNKDLALILNISPKSVQMARYRIKKKMNLDPDINLIRYIEKIQA